MLMVTAIEPLIGGLKCKKLFFKNLRIIEPLIGGLKCSFAFLERGAVK